MKYKFGDLLLYQFASDLPEMDKFVIFIEKSSDPRFCDHSVVYDINEGQFCYWMYNGFLKHAH